MKLGDGFQISIGTKSIVKSLEFYKKLGFKEVEQNAASYNWQLITDGTIKLLLHQDKFKGLGYFAVNMPQRVEKLKSSGVKFEEYKLQLNQYYQVFKDPNGFYISLIQQDAYNMFQPSGNSFSTAGVFDQVYIKSKSIKRSIEFWSGLGFELIASDLEENPYAILTDGLVKVGFYSVKACPYFFDKCAFAYLSSNSSERIKKLKQKKINFINEIKDGTNEVSGAVALSPEEETFFIFNYNHDLMKGENHEQVRKDP